MAHPSANLSGTPRLGFLGSTSFGATLVESGNAIGAGAGGSQASSITDETWNHNLDSPDRPSQVQKGATCLALLMGDISKFPALIENWHKYLSGMSMLTPCLTACASALQIQIYNECVDKDALAIEEFLLEASAKIFENTMRPLPVYADCSMEDFTDSFSGKCLRWEAVGIYLNALAEASMAFSHANARVPGARFAQIPLRTTRSLLEGSDFCLSSCQEIGQLSDPEIWLQIDNRYVWTLFAGDASYDTWRRLGDVISACTARGLHEEISVSSGIPFWMSEMRKRAFARVYNEDKQLSSFVGRPPRLHRKYCFIQLPLDLEYEQLKLTGTKLEAAVHRLDNDGWNEQHHVSLEVHLRAQLLTNMIREDILELALTKLPVDDAYTARELLNRSQAVRESLPTWICDPVGARGVSNWLTKSIRLNFVYNDFLLQRVMVKKLNHPKDELIRLARELISGVMELVNSLSNYAQFSLNMSWSLAKYALPPAGVLGLELLQERQTSMNSPIYTHRSEVIQNLSSLVACLRWAVFKQDGNYKICFQAREVLQRILDRVLNGEEFPDQDYGRFDDVLGWMPEDITAESSEATVSSWNERAVIGSEVEFWSSLLPSHPFLQGAAD